MITQAELQHLHETLAELAHENPVVRACVEMNNAGRCTFDQALLWAVIEFAKQNKELQNHLLVELQHKPPPAIYLTR